MLLAHLVVGHRERHELLERHTVLRIYVEELLGNRGELEPLLHDGRMDEKAGRDVLLAQTLLAQGLEGAELIEWMEGSTLDVLGERILLGDAIGAHDARHQLGLIHALLLHKQLEGPVSAAAGGHLEHAGLPALGGDHCPDIEALQERTVGDVLSKLLDGDAGLHPAHIGLAEHKLVEGDVTGRVERDLASGGCHVDVLRDGRSRDPPSTSKPVTDRPGLPLTFPASPAVERNHRC